jgi:hypothetical protein
MSEPAAETYSWVNQTIILAACSALAYVYAYLYEAGFCEHFHIPVELIKIDTVRILIVGITLFGALYSALMLYEYLLKGIIKKASSLKRRLLYTVPLLLIFGYTVWKTPDRALAYAWLLCLASMIYLDIVWKPNPTPPPDNIPSPFGILYPLSQKLGKWTVNLFVYAIVLGIAVQHLGNSTASGMSEFLVPDTAPPYQVVLKIYGDTVICAKADFTKHEIYPMLSFHSVTSDFSKTLVIRHFKKMEVIDDWKPK